MSASSARLILDTPALGSWNMAVDQAVLTEADKNGQVTLRFYAWEQPTLSLGYFQSAHDRDSHLPSKSCPLVRRATGGGAILHDHEITYSLCIPSRNRWSDAHQRLYPTIHTCILDVLQQYGLSASLYDSSGSVSTDETYEVCSALLPEKSGRNRNSCPVGEFSQTVKNPFLCFQRRSKGDIVLDTHKIGGSAQRRNKNAILQHGSLLLRTSDYAPELPGIEDLGPIKKISHKDFAEQCSRKIGDALGVNWEVAGLRDSETQLALEYNNLFLSSNWLNKKMRLLG